MTIVDQWPSATYKFTPPDNISKHSGYFTIVGMGEPDEIMGEPIAFFFNSKEMASFQWSRELKAGVPIEEIIIDMEGTFDPNGSYHTKNGEVHSTVHHMGIFVKKHMEYIIEKWAEAEVTIEGETEK